AQDTPAQDRGGPVTHLHTRAAVVRDFAIRQPAGGVAADPDSRALAVMDLAPGQHRPGLGTGDGDARFTLGRDVAFKDLDPAEGNLQGRPLAPSGGLAAQAQPAQRPAVGPRSHARGAVALQDNLASRSIADEVDRLVEQHALPIPPGPYANGGTL